MTRERAGKRSYTQTERKRGRYIKARPAGDRPEDIAFDATLRAAAPFQQQRLAEATNDLAKGICNAKYACAARET
jgi:magnesium chelatase subunit D